MGVVLIRKAKSPDVTVGTLLIVKNSAVVYKAHSIELPWKDNQRNISCVPDGIYKIEYEHSDKFNRFLWELKGVPNRSEIKIHPANSKDELAGCIALGTDITYKEDGTVYLSLSTAKVNQFNHAMRGTTVSKISIITI